MASNPEVALDPEPAPTDVVTPGEYHFLDVGDEKYGECILVIFGAVRVLFDGSHQRDFVGRNGRKSIPDQLSEILGEEAPHHISTIVVTHGHADHIGCLPELVSEEIIRADWAYLTHPKLGFGRGISDALPDDAISNPRQRLVAALREEDASDLEDADLRAFIDAAVTVESRYADFIDSLKTQGTRVVFHEGKALPSDLAKLLRSTGATLFGPSANQLLLCADQISKTNKGAEDAADSLLRADASLDDVSLYRAAVDMPQAQADAVRNPRGSGMNCQSIVFAFGPKNARVLLAGDMQFAEPGVKDADGEVKRLRDAVVAAGPYKVFKTTHHTSHNGQDDALLTDLGDPPIIVHSGGLKDPAHPFPGTLELLKARRSQIRFARTDRNGHITVRPQLDGADAIEKSRGRLNDFTDNTGDSEAESGGSSMAPLSAAPPGTEPRSTAQIIIVNLPEGVVDMSVGGVDIVVRTPAGNKPRAEVDRPRSTGGGLTPSSPKPAPLANPKPPGPVVLAAGRAIPKLLFVTDPVRLTANVGSAEAAAALNAVAAAGHSVCKVDGITGDPVAACRSALRGSPDVRGVVLLGGYDVVPSVAVNVLDTALAARLGRTVIVDDDHFIVWTDEPYGDTDGDRIGEYPVSRIPDARDARLLFAALGCKGSAAAERFGVRNLARPFADEVWTSVSGRSLLNVSELFVYSSVSPPELEARSQYFMLHGDWRDGRVFSGEVANQGGYTHAFDVRNVPPQFDGVVFAGCCWGALTVSQKAVDAGGAPIAPRVAERSIALMYLKAGASAFVGCTGSHYSGPDPDPTVNYASVLHSAFWQALPANGFSAAAALHRAKAEYSRDLARSGDALEPIEVARRLKNRAQFTCLGLGW